MKRHALIISLMFCSAAALALAPAVTDCGATPSTDACTAKPKNTDIFGQPVPAEAAREEKGPGTNNSRPEKRSDGPDRGLPVPDTGARTSELPAGGRPDFSSLERASTAFHIWLGLALALLALSEAFAADNPGRRRLSLAGCALAAVLALGSLAAASVKLGPDARVLLAFRPGFLLYYGAGLLTASAALSQLLSRHSDGGTGFWGAVSAFFLASAGAVLLAAQARVNPEAAAFVMAGHVPVGAALLAAGAVRAFLLFSASKPARAALAVFLFVAAAMSGLYRESPDAFSLHFTTMTGAADEPPAAVTEKAATGRTNEEAADKKGPRG
ncbi:MAG: hypothetical protein RQ748_06380 [Elusimicrobiales bacterium]|nr:hypothetical protein [Elusimicrobiales bacterium]